MQVPGTSLSVLTAGQGGLRLHGVWTEGLSVPPPVDREGTGFLCSEGLPVTGSW